MEEIKMTKGEVIEKHRALEEVMASTEKMDSDFLFKVDRIRAAFKSEVVSFRNVWKPKGKHKDYEEKAERLMRDKFCMKGPDGKTPLIRTDANGNTSLQAEDPAKWEVARTKLQEDCGLPVDFFEVRNKEYQEDLEKEVTIGYRQIPLALKPKDMLAKFMLAVGCFVKDEEETTSSKENSSNKQPTPINKKKKSAGKEK